jgi:hypothetical protein
LEFETGSIKYWRGSGELLLRMAKLKLCWVYLFMAYASKYNIGSSWPLYAKTVFACEDR